MMDRTAEDTSAKVPGASTAGEPGPTQSPTPEVIRQRLTGPFSTAYLTLESIIQGVALTTLVSRVEATYGSFAAADWVLSTTTFLVILIVWHEYLTQSLLYTWLPTFLDSLVPFAFLVDELFLAHLVYQTERAWLLAYGGFYLVGLAAWSYHNRQVQSADYDSRRVNRVLEWHDRAQGLILAVLAVLILAAGALYDVLGLGQVRLGVALGALVAGCVYLGRSVPPWNGLLAYARRGSERGTWH
jgi:hypothetical protein